MASDCLVAWQVLAARSAAARPFTPRPFTPATANRIRMHADLEGERHALGYFQPVAGRGAVMSARGGAEEPSLMDGVLAAHASLAPHTLAHPPAHASLGPRRPARGGAGSAVVGTASSAGSSSARPASTHGSTGRGAVLSARPASTHGSTGRASGRAGASVGDGQRATSARYGARDRRGSSNGTAVLAPFGAPDTAPTDTAPAETFHDPELLRLLLDEAGGSAEEARASSWAPAMFGGSAEAIDEAVVEAQAASAAFAARAAAAAKAEAQAAAAMDAAMEAEMDADMLAIVEATARSPLGCGHGGWRARHSAGGAAQAEDLLAFVSVAEEARASSWAQAEHEADEADEAAMDAALMAEEMAAEAAVAANAAAQAASEAAEAADAAIRLQALRRGQAARAAAAARKQEAAAENAAATKLQAIKRGSSERARLQAERAQEQKAAIKLQAVKRGHGARSHAAVLRAQSANGTTGAHYGADEPAHYGAHCADGTTGAAVAELLHTDAALGDDPPEGVNVPLEGVNAPAYVTQIRTTHWKASRAQRTS